MLNCFKSNCCIQHHHVMYYLPCTMSSCQYMMWTYHRPTTGECPIEHYSNLPWPPTLSSIISSNYVVLGNIGISTTTRECSTLNCYYFILWAWCNWNKVLKEIPIWWCTRIPSYIEALSCLEYLCRADYHMVLTYGMADAVSFFCGKSSSTDGQPLGALADLDDHVILSLDHWRKKGI